MILLAPIEIGKQKWFTACHKTHQFGELRCGKKDNLY